VALGPVLVVAALLAAETGTTEQTAEQASGQATEQTEQPASAPEPSPPRAPALVRPFVLTFAETFLIVGANAGWYWSHPGSNSNDFDIHFDWSSWKAKLFSSRDIVFDDNRLGMNAVGHPVAGTVYYQIARGNGLGMAASFVSAALASTAWEYLVEYNEKPSLNDLVITPVAGAVIGEATYQIGRYFAAGPPTPVNELGALVFSPVATVNEWLGLRPSPARGRAWHQLDLGAGGVLSAFSGGPTQQGFRIVAADRMLASRAYRSAVPGALSLGPGQWTQLDGFLLVTDGAVNGQFFDGHVLVWGRYLRQPAAEGAAPAPPGVRPDGGGLLLGVGSSFDYYDRWQPTFRDRSSTAGIFGQVVELERRRGIFDLRATLTAVYGLALVKSLAYPTFDGLVTGEVIKTELRYHGYYYAQGLISNGRVTLGIDGNLELALACRVESFWSINARDRFQPKLQNDFALYDQRITSGGSVARRLFNGPFRLAGTFERVLRAGHMMGEEVANQETRASLMLVGSF